MKKKTEDWWKENERVTEEERMKNRQGAGTGVKWNEGRREMEKEREGRMRKQAKE